MPSVLKCCSVHSYADDTQLVFSFDPDLSRVSVRNLNDDLLRLSSWVLKNGLTVNPSKSSVLAIGNKYNRYKFLAHNLNIIFDGKTLPFSSYVKSLGIYIDEELNFTEHVNKKLQCAYSRLKSIFPFRSGLCNSIKLNLCRSLVLSIIEYCDTVYVPNLRMIDLNRLRLLQNSCVRFSYGIRKFDHISQHRIMCNMNSVYNNMLVHFLIFLHKVVLTGEPDYLFAKLLWRDTSIGHFNLRNHDQISIPRHRTNKFKSSFSYMAAKWYNKLPVEFKSLNLISFKSKIKGFLDSTDFSLW